MPTLSPDIIAAIAAGKFHDVGAVLGPHLIEVEGQPALAIRAFLPHALEATVVSLGSQPSLAPMQKIHDDGVFEAVIGETQNAFRYRLLVVSGAVPAQDTEDPYAFPPLLSDFDLHLIGEGTHYRTYEILGAHVREVNGVRGVHFAVWAPHAGRVSVIGEFNQWDGRTHVMRCHEGVGVWELFVPNVTVGASYKYEVMNADFTRKADKSDPYSFYAELRPNTASVVYDLDHYAWHDADWMTNRTAIALREANPVVSGTNGGLQRPVSIYEVHLGSWRRVLPPLLEMGERGSGSDRWLTYRELAHQLAEYVMQMGYTHVELLPVTEHPYDGSWGYQTVGYFAPTSRHGTPEDFMYFVDYLHQHGIGVLLDWVPAHFPKDAHGLNYFDGTHLYEYADPRRGEQMDWGTVIFDYGRSEVRNFLLSSALFWLTKYHMDGLRVDAVASMLYHDYSRKPGEWLANKYGGRENLEAIDFLKRFNELTHAEQPGILTIAEESTAWPLVSRPIHLGGLGFDLKWNMGWMHDMLKYMAMDPLFRRNNQSLITFSLMYAFSENFILPLSHDEVVHLKKSLLDKMPGDTGQKFANLRALYGYMWTHPGKKLLFMGGEFGQWREWSEARSLDWHLLDGDARHRQLQRYVADLNKVYRAEAALYILDFGWDGFAWIDVQDIDHSVIAFMRRAQALEDFVVVVCNFTPVPRFGYRVGVAAPGEYRELLNSDAQQYGGSGLGNVAPVLADEIAWQSQPYSIVVTLPPLSTIILKKAPDPHSQIPT